MRAALSTLWRAAHPAGPAELVDALRRAGAERIVLDPTLSDDLADAVLAGHGAVVAALEHTGRARLCADQRDERAAAVDAAAAALRRAADAGVPVCVLALGSIPVSCDRAALAHAFARDAWAPDAGMGARLLAERAARALRHQDAARFALERLVALAERAGVQLAIGPRPEPAALPNVDEAAALLVDFRGAPLHYWHDTAAAHGEQALGLGQPADWLQRLGAAALGARAADACGLEAPLAPGLGEVDFSPLARLPLAAVTAPAETTPEELAAALALLSAL